MKKVGMIHTGNVPKAIGAYSQATCAGDFIFISGQPPSQYIPYLVKD